MRINLINDKSIVRRIISIDPSGNGNTGVFVGYYNETLKQFIKGYQKTFNIKEFDLLMDFLLPHLRGDYHQCSVTKPILVIEDYVDRGISKDNSTKALIEKIRWHCYQINKHLIFYLQQPSNKALWTNARLLDIGILKKETNHYCLKGFFDRPSRHVVDALRHFLFRIVAIYQYKIDLKQFFGEY